MIGGGSCFYEWVGGWVGHDWVFLSWMLNIVEPDMMSLCW